MNFGNLKSLGHNIADSLASGIGLMIGVYEMDVFGEAASSTEGYITVDFLTGTTSGGKTSASLRQAIGLYRDALPQFCAKQGIDISAVKQLIARFGTDSVYGPHFKVTVENTSGKHSTDQYVGTPGKKLRPKS